MGNLRVAIDWLGTKRHSCEAKTRPNDLQGTVNCDLLFARFTAKYDLRCIFSECI